MKTYREECIHVKAVREGIIEQRPVRGKRNKKRPVILEYRTQPNPRWRFFRFGKWAKRKAYRSTKEAEIAMQNLQRKYPNLWEFRIK